LSGRHEHGLARGCKLLGRSCRGFRRAAKCINSNQSSKHRIRSHAPTISRKTIIRSQYTDKRDKHGINIRLTSNLRGDRVQETLGAPDERDAAGEVDSAGAGGSCSGLSVSAGSNCDGADAGVGQGPTARASVACEREVHALRAVEADVEADVIAARVRDHDSRARPRVVQACSAGRTTARGASTTRGRTYVAGTMGMS
jgi:hypothetical protein